MALHFASLNACFINVVQSEVWCGGVGGVHCALDLKWGGAETMAMKKTWQGCEKQLTSITGDGMVPQMVQEKVPVRYRENIHSSLC